MSTRVVLAYKNFAAAKGISHIGLGVAAMNNMQTLRNNGIQTEVWPISTAADLAARLSKTQYTALQMKTQPVTHVIISAPWIPTANLQELLMQHPEVDFAVVSHSNVGFLMADPQGIKLLRDGIELQISHHNFSVAGNSQKFCDAWTKMYGVETAYLPNLYNTETMRAVGERTPWNGGVIRVGIFGAVRPLKNMVSAVAACIQMSAILKNDIEVWMSAGRQEGDTTSQQAINQLVTGLPHVKVVNTGWASWSAFRQTVNRMHLLLQPSYTESFNMVTADGIVEGVASVVSDAIDWVPGAWVARADEVADISRIGVSHLHDTHAVMAGQRALQTYVTAGIGSWKKHLGV
jgi:hypothetical protein